MSERKIYSQMKYDTSDLERLQGVVRLVIGELKPKTAVLLYGDLGTGKTQFVKYVVEALQGRFPASPSFSLENIYETKLGPLHHFDLYRLESADDIESSGFWDAF